MALLGIVVAGVGSSAVLAAPPPVGTSGSLLQLAPVSGRAAASFTADYWYVDPFGGKCAYKTVEFSWDGKLIKSVKVEPPDPKDLVYCAATHVVVRAPTTAVGGHVVSAVACSVDVNGVKTCPGFTLARTTYTVRPTPTLRLSPTGGLAAAPFTASYATGDGASCPYNAAEFLWDGAAVGSKVALDPSTCRATLDLTRAPSPRTIGTHRVRAEACINTRCLAGTVATATYTVRAPKPTPSPRPTPTPTPTPSPSPTPTAAPTPTASPTTSPTPSVRPTARPTVPPSPTDSPAPTGGVLGGTDPGAPPAGGSPYVPEMASFVAGPVAGGIDPAVVATNLFLTLLLVFLFALTAEIFNSTMDANRDEIHGWWARLMRGPFRIFGALTVPGASLTRLAGSGRLGSALRVLAVLSLLGLIYSVLSPDFGWNSQTLTLFVSLVLGLGFMTYFQEGSVTRLATRRYRVDASIRLYGTAVFVSILAVVISRLVTFQPGLVYGFVASAVIVAPVALDRRDDATLVLVPAIGLLVVSVAAWLLLGPVRAAAAGGDWAPGLAETVLAMIVIGGLETLFVSMIPLRFMDGAAVMGWSRLAWALTFGAVTFLWWQLLLNQNHAYVSAMEQTNVQVVLATVVVFMLTTGGLWSYFRFRPARPEVQAEA